MISLPISICSFNINGTKDKDICIDNLLDTFDVVLFQEHLLPAVSVNFLRRSPGHIVFSTNARRTRGRPSGGLACVLNRKLSSLSPQCYGSDDIYLAVRIGDLVLVNVYLPHNKNNLASFTHFVKACKKLKNLVSGIEKLGYDWLLMGDMNCDMTMSSPRSDSLLECLPLGFRILTKDLPFTYIHASGSRSNLDHCVCSAGVTTSTVHVDEDERDYDHIPISLCVSVTSKLVINAPQSVEKKWFQRRNWNRCDWPLYVATLASLLSTINVPYNLLCCGVTSPSARLQLNTYYHQIILCLKKTEQVAVPIERIRSNTRKFVWNYDPLLKKVKNQAKLWLRIWIACGRPSRGTVFDIKRKTKTAYKRQLRSVREAGVNFPNSSKEWKFVTNSSKFTDYKSDNIPQSAWIQHYSNIFSRVNFAVHSRYSQLLAKCLPGKMQQKHVLPVSADIITESIRRLKSQSIDIDGISVFHLRKDSRELVKHLQLLFQMCLCCSLVPDSFLCGTVTSIVKRGKDVNKCDSYRPITVACNISKLFEYVLLPYIIDFVNYDANQFGFRKGISCHYAHRVLALLFKDAQTKGQSLHICALDISKAFDSVVHPQAFYSLHQLGINPSIISLLRFWYSNSYVRLKSNGCVFGNIPVKSGVRQGGVLSPYIFNACISSVINKIPSSCFFGFSEVSYLAYADDLLLISRSKRRLEWNVSMVGSMLSEIGLSLNTLKCEYLLFNAVNPPATPLACNTFTVPRVPVIKWLGISICESVGSIRRKFICDSKDKLKAGYGKIVANRGRFNRHGLAKLYCSFCDHAILSASGLYPLFTKHDLKQMKVNYFRYCKFLLYLPLAVRNRRLVGRYGATAILSSLETVQAKISQDASFRLGPHHSLIRFFY